MHSLTRQGARLPAGDRARDVDEGALPGGAGERACRTPSRSRCASASRSCSPPGSSSPARPTAGRSTSRCATPSAAHRTSTATSSRSRPNPRTGGSRDAHRDRGQGHGRAQHGARPALAEQTGRLGPARPHPHPQAGRAGAVHRDQERLPLGDRRGAHLQGSAEARPPGPSGAEQAARPLRHHPRRRAADAAGRGSRLRRVEAAPRRQAGRLRLRDSGRAAGPGQRARHQHARRPRGARTA